MNKLEEDKDVATAALISEVPEEAKVVPNFLVTDYHS